MKKLLCLSSLLFVFSASAEFHNVAKKTCNGVEVDIKKNERVYVSVKKQLLGFGYTDSEDCRIVDFSNFFIQRLSQSTISGTTAEVAYVDGIARMNTCVEGTELYQGITEYSALIENNKVTVYNNELVDCEEMVLILK